MKCEICNESKLLGAITIFNFRPDERDLYRIELCGICIDCMYEIQEFIRVKELGYLDCLLEHEGVAGIKEDKRRKHIVHGSTGIQGKCPVNHDMGQQLINHV